VNATIAVSAATATAVTRPAQPSGGQRHHHDERDQDQDQDNAVVVADPPRQLEPGLTAIAPTTQSAAALCALIRHAWSFGRADTPSCSLHQTTRRRTCRSERPARERPRT
jgi:hypothetical protein